MKEFQTQAFKMIIHDDRLKEFIIRKDHQLEAEDVLESLKLSNVHSPGEKYYTIVESEDGAKVTNEARRVVASGAYSSYTAALALCSSNVLMAIAGNLFLKINRPKVPTRFFDNRESALRWLRSMMEAGGKAN